MSDQVPNRYRQELGEALPAERFRRAATDRVLWIVQDALAQGAWESTAADRFSAEVTTQQTTASTAAERALGEMTGRHAREPAQVDPDDWRARFQG